jgi:septal ring factor EnvC (AmiA/AmiB activator)
MQNLQLSRSFVGPRWRLWLLCLSVVALLTLCAPPLPAQSNPFDEPLRLSTTLVQQIQSLADNLTALSKQVNDSQVTLIQQSAIIQDLQSRIESSRVSLVLLQGQLSLSEQAQTTLSESLVSSQTSLADSETHLKEAQSEAGRIASNTILLKVAIWSVSILAAGEAVYIVGHVFKLW